MPEESTKDGQFVPKGTKPVLYLSTNQVGHLPGLSPLLPGSLRTRNMNTAKLHVQHTAS